MRYFSQTLSWLFLPLFVPIYVLLLILFDSSNLDFYFNPDARWALLKMFLIFFTFAPGLTMIFMRRYQLIQTIEMEDQKDRFGPLLIVALYSLAAFGLFYVKDEMHLLPIYIYLLPIIGLVNAFVFFGFNFWIKISLHSGTMGMAVGFLFVHAYQHSFFPKTYLIWVILASGLVIGARLQLRKHTSLEAYLGWLVGFATTIILSSLGYTLINSI